MLTIRLSRTGKKNQPSFRIIVQEHTASPKGEALESLGYYKPAVEPKIFKVDMERVKHWIKVGAKPSDTMAVLLKKEGLTGMEKYIEPRTKKRKSKSETTATAQAGGVAPEAPKAAEKPAEKAAEKPQEQPDAK